MWWVLPEALVRLLVPDEAPPKLCLDKNPWRTIRDIVAMLGSVVLFAPSFREIVLSSP